MTDRNTRPAYRLEARNGSNTDCMTLHVRDDEAVAQLAAVLPALAECGGYDGQLLDPDCRNDLLDYQGGKQCDNAWTGSVRAEQNSTQLIEVDMSVDYQDVDGDYCWALTTSTRSTVLRGVPVVVTRRYNTARSWRAPRPNVRRETAKAVANFLAVTCTPEAAAERAAAAECAATDTAKWLATQSALVALQSERMVAMAELSGSTKTEQELRAILADAVAKAAGSGIAMKDLAERIRSAVARRWETLDAAQSDAWDAIDYELCRNA